MSATIRLTPQAFTAAVQRTRLKDRSREIARDVLVDGQRQSDAAHFYGVTQQAVSLAVRRVTSAARACPHCGRHD